MLAQRLRELRKLKGMTQAQLAISLGVSPSTVGMYEQGRREPDHETLSRLCEIFHVSTDFLLGSGALTQKKDLNTIVEAMREAILQQDGLMFNGEPVNPADSEKIIDAIKLGISFVMGQKN
ncbi:MAG: helix-turn-helix transcriptional regulator [Hydrogenoanaerobacterium sp.]